MLICDCPECGGFLTAYEREYVALDAEYLYRFRHSIEQNTDCEGYMQVRRSEFEDHGVEEVDG